VIIKTLTYAFEERRKLVDALCEIKKMFYAFKQGTHMPLQQYHDQFQGQVAVLDKVGVTIADESLVESVAAQNGRAGAPVEADHIAAREQTPAMQFISGTNAKYKEYLTHLRNSFLDGSDYYPTSVHAAYNILQRRESEGRSVDMKPTDSPLSMQEEKHGIWTTLSVFTATSSGTLPTIALTGVRESNGRAPICAQLALVTFRPAGCY
jgi:hypothetical protein